MKNIEYEKDGIRKFAGECFKNDLIAVGWKVVEQETPKSKPGRKPKAKGVEDDNSTQDN